MYCQPGRPCRRENRQSQAVVTAMRTSELMDGSAVQFDQRAVRARDILSGFGLTASRLRRIKRGRNTHWIVEAPGGRVVLRKYAIECTPGEVAYELQVLEHLDRRG